MPQYEIIWNTQARRQLKNIYNYIQEQSAQNAKKVLDKILDTVEGLNKNPERYGLDKYKKDNDGSYRYIEIYRYRVAYRIYKNQIRILRVRSTDQEPLDY